jgi:putative thiamine transport system ATP-binding protein
MLELKNLSLKVSGKQLIKSLTLRIAPGDIVTLLGASGSGKSSLLSVIGGDLTDAFEWSGEIWLNGNEISHQPPEKRAIGRLFQDDLLFPHMSVGENLLYAMPRLPRSEKWRNVDIALQRADLEGYRDRAPHTLSGGQRARIALMRTLLAKPNAILLDEPFSKLDQDLRAQIRDYTFAHIRERAIPAILVTHDAADAPPGGRLLKINTSGEIADV